MGLLNHIMCFLVFHAGDPPRLLQASPPPPPTPGRGLSGLSVIMPMLPLWRRPALEGVSGLASQEPPVTHFETSPECRGLWLCHPLLWQRDEWTRLEPLGCPRGALKWEPAWEVGGSTVPHLTHSAGQIPDVRTGTAVRLSHVCMVLSKFSEPGFSYLKTEVIAPDGAVLRNTWDNIGHASGTEPFQWVPRSGHLLSFHHHRAVQVSFCPRLPHQAHPGLCVWQCQDIVAGR